MSVNLKGPEQSGCHLADPTNSNINGCDVDTALMYAAGWRKVHLRAAGQHSAARNANALIGIPASAVAVFYGISGHGSPDRISRLSLGAAGYYSASSFLAPPGKQRAYLEGALALSCAIDAGLQYRVPSARVNALEGAVQAAIADELRLSDVIADAGGALPADAPVLARAAVTLSDSANLIDGARELQDTYSRAALTLVGVVDRIVVQTAQLASSQETGLQSLLAMAGSLRQTANGFGLSSLPASTSTPGEGGKINPQSANGEDADAARARSVRDAAARRIEAATAALRRSLVSLAIMVRGMSARTVNAEGYDLCRPATAFTGFKVEPAETSRAVKVGEVIRFVITNTQSNAYPTALVGSNAAAVEVSEPKVIEGKLILEVRGKKATGAEPAMLLITDPTGALTLRYTIAVLPAAPEPPASSPARTSAPINSKFSSDFTKDDIKRLQCHLGLVGPQSDGVMGDSTYAALSAFARRNGLTVGEELSQNLFDEVLSRGTNHCSGVRQ